MPGVLGMGMSRATRKLGRLIRTRRLEKSLTQTDLQNRSGVAQRTISDLERGKSKSTSRDTIRRIARSLGYKINDLMPLMKSRRRKRVTRAALGRTIYQERKKKGQSLQEFSRIVDIPVESLRSYELGRYRNMCGRNIVKLSRIKGIPKKILRKARLLRTVEKPKRAVSHKIRSNRRSLGLTQTELAEHIGMTRQSLSFIESGVTKNSRYIKKILEIVSILKRKAEKEAA